MLIDAISKELKIPIAFVDATIRSANSAYKEYNIKKKDGSDRKIEHPARKLKVLQRWIARRIFSLLPVHQCATAYIKGSSILENASLHAGKRFLLKMDFQEYFHSIKSKDVEHLLKSRVDLLKNSATDAEIELICRIVCRRGSLVVGAPSSPSVSNAVMFQFDSIIHAYCTKMNVVYSRYADDLTFSSNEIGCLDQVHKFVNLTTTNLATPQLKINDAKTHHSSKKRRMRVTGLILTSQGSISVGRLQKRRVRSLIHRVCLGTLDPEKRGYLQGYLNFVADVEPQFLSSLSDKYGAAIIANLRK